MDIAKQIEMKKKGIAPGLPKKTKKQKQREAIDKLPVVNAEEALKLTFDKDK